MSVLDQDASFVGEFLAVAMDILVRTMRARAAKDHGLADGGARFSLAPKKVKQGMNKVMVLLHASMQPWDYVEVAVCKSGDPVRVPTRTRNPYTIQFAVPESMLDVSAMVNVTVSVNGLSLGCRQLKCEGRLRELDRILRAKDNPVQFLCQVRRVRSTSPKFQIELPEFSKNCMKQHFAGGYSLPICNFSTIYSHFITYLKSALSLLHRRWDSVRTTVRRWTTLC